MSRVAIIGAGAGGTLAAVHLMRASEQLGQTEIFLVDRAGSFGPGVAYATRDDNHLLNVPAVRMGGIAGDPEHFHAWLRERGHQDGPAAFVPRGAFGDYLRDLLASSEAASTAWVRLHRLEDEAVALGHPAGASGPLEVHFSGRPPLQVDRVVLALGPLPAADPIGVPERVRESGAYVASAWAPGALEEARSAGSVVVLGAGLTMVDTVLSLCRDGAGPTVRVVSRSGLLPRRHREGLTNLQPFSLPADGGELAPIVTALLQQIARVGRSGGDWRDVLDSLRPATPAIWRGLRVSEQRRFLADLHRLWDVHRFRMPPRIADAFEDLVAGGQVEVGAGAVLAVEPSERGARVSIRPAGREAVEVVDCDRLFNCAGAGTNVVRDATPLVADLLASGSARPDPLSLGLDVAPDGSLIDSRGRLSDRIHVVGCLRKGVEWEAIGITEIREHAAAIAAATTDANALGRVAA